MKRIFAALALLGLFALPIQAQDTSGVSRSGLRIDTNGRAIVIPAPGFIRTYTITATGAQTSIDVRNLGVLNWRIVYQGSGTVSTCTVKLEQSADASSWSDLIANETCTSNGQSAITSGTPNYVRINQTAISGSGASMSIRLEGMFNSGTFADGGTVQGMAADGAASGGNPVEVAGLDSSGNAQSLQVNTSGGVIIATQSAGADGVTDTLSNPNSGTPASASPYRSMEFGFNGTSWDRQRNNEEVTVLASAARTAQTDSSDLVNYDASGLMLFVDITVDPTTASITPNLMAKDPVSGNYVTIWTAAAALNGVGTTVYYLYPGALAADFDGTEAASIGVPRTFKFRMTVADAESMTYSVGASYIK